ncbi:MAG: hypothetical protein HDS42_05675 [Bacteroides sp.]|nr:hypothetical protein [Bacteroides sp.]
MSYSDLAVVKALLPMLGSARIPNIQSKIDTMIEKYRLKTIDIEDEEFEEYYLELDSLFPENKEISENE